MSSSDTDGDFNVRGSMLCPNALSCFLSAGLPCSWPLWLCSCMTLSQNENATVMYWGKYQGSLGAPGIYVLNPCGQTVRKVSVQKQTQRLNDLKCNDARGNPIVVSGNIVYRVCSVKRALVDVQDHVGFLMQQAPMALRMVCAKYPYDSNEGVSLRHSSEGHKVGEDLRTSLQSEVRDAGIEILKFDLTDLSYAPEIAGAMLQKQQAMALMDARQVTVRSAVEIASSAVSLIKNLGHSITPAGEEKLITNLVTVIVSDRPVQNTMSLA